MHEHYWRRRLARLEILDTQRMCARSHTDSALANSAPKQQGSIAASLTLTGLYTFDRYQPEISRKPGRIAVYGTQRAGSLGSSGSLWEDAHIVSRYQPVPNNPKIALIMLSTTERPLNIDQAKSANAQSENTSTMPLLLKLPPRFCFVSCTSRRLCTQSTVVNRRLHVLTAGH